MEKVIVIDGKEIPVKACASTAIRYQQVFGEHIDKELLEMAGKSKNDFGGGVFESAGKLLYIMAWHCDHSLKLNRGAALEWLDSLGPLDGTAIKEIMLLFFRKQENLCGGEKEKPENGAGAVTGASISAR